MVARGAKRSIKVATASHFLFADCRFIAGVLVVGVKQGRGGFCSGWSWCHTTSDKKDLFTSVTPLQASNSGGRGAILRLTYNFYSLRLMCTICAFAYFRSLCFVH